MACRGLARCPWRATAADRAEPVTRPRRGGPTSRQSLRHPFGMTGQIVERPAHRLHPAQQPGGIHRIVGFGFRRQARGPGARDCRRATGCAGCLWWCAATARSATDGRRAGIRAPARLSPCCRARPDHGSTARLRRKFVGPPQQVLPPDHDQTPHGGLCGAQPSQDRAIHMPRHSLHDPARRNAHQPRQRGQHPQDGGGVVDDGGFGGGHGVPAIEHNRNKLTAKTPGVKTGTARSCLHLGDGDAARLARSAKNCRNGEIGDRPREGT